MENVSVFIDEQIKRIAELIRSEEEKAVKDLLSIAGVNPAAVDHSNYEIVKRDMNHRGYDITMDMRNGKSIYELQKDGRFVCGFRIGSDIEFKDGKMNVTVKREVIKASDR